MLSTLRLYTYSIRAALVQGIAHAARVQGITHAARRCIISYLPYCVSGASPMTDISEYCEVNCCGFIGSKYAEIISVLMNESQVSHQT